jgi:hypothetical protein
MKNTNETPKQPKETLEQQIKRRMDKIKADKATEILVDVKKR